MQSRTSTIQYEPRATDRVGLISGSRPSQSSARAWNGAIPRAWGLGLLQILRLSLARSNKTIKIQRLQTKCSIGMKVVLRVLKFKSNLLKDAGQSKD